MVELIPEYLFTRDKIKEHRLAMKSRVKKLALLAEKLSEKENTPDTKFIAKYFHSFCHAFTYCNAIAKSTYDFVGVTRDKIKEHRLAMKSRVKKLALLAEKLSEKEKELFIHDFNVKNVKYDKLKKDTPRNHR